MMKVLKNRKFIIKRDAFSIRYYGYDAILKLKLKVLRIVKVFLDKKQLQFIFSQSPVHNKFSNRTIFLKSIAPRNYSMCWIL